MKDRCFSTVILVSVCMQDKLLRVSCEVFFKIAGRLQKTERKERILAMHIFKQTLFQFFNVLKKKMPCIFSNEHCFSSSMYSRRKCHAYCQHGNQSRSSCLNIICIVYLSNYIEIISTFSLHMLYSMRAFFFFSDIIQNIMSEKLVLFL